MSRSRSAQGRQVLARAIADAVEDDWSLPEPDPRNDVLDSATGRPRVLSEQCATCVFHPGNRMRLAQGRLKELVEANTSQGAGLTCHETLPGVSGHDPAWCRGFYDRYPDTAVFLLAREAMGGPVEVAPPVLPE